MFVFRSSLQNAIYFVYEDNLYQQKEAIFLRTRMEILENILKVKLIIRNLPMVDFGMHTEIDS